ncbi:proline-rich transmembrane protein 4 isoform 2-T2 [Pholidichthys leucotaenia]
MLRLHGTLAFFLWYVLLLHRRALADEEALWGPTPSKEKLPEKKANSYWWTPSLPKLPSLPSFPFRIPFFGSSNGKDEAGEVTTLGQGLTEPVDPYSGSGDGSISEASQPPTGLTHGLLTSVTKIRTEPPPTGTSDSPHSSSLHSDNDALVSHSYSPTSSSIRNTQFTNSPTSTNAPEQNATHTLPPRSTTRTAEAGMGATTQHLPEEEHSFYQKNIMTSTIAPETTVPTALTWAAAAKTMTTTPGFVDTTPTGRHTPGPASSSETTAVGGPQDLAVSSTLHPAVITVSKSFPTQRESDHGFTYSWPWGIFTSLGTNHKRIPESITSTTQMQRLGVTTKGVLPSKEDKEDGEGANSMAANVDGDTTLPDISTKLLTASLTQSPGISSETPHVLPYTEEWISYLPESDVTLLPDCNKEHSGICNLSETWDSTTFADIKPTQNSTATNQSIDHLLLPAPPMLVPLYADWNSAMAAWGLAWEAHVYGAGCIFAMLTIASALNLLCLPLRCPSGCGYFALVSLFLLAAGCTRSFSLLYDAYGHQDRLPSTEASMMLYEAPFPCLTAAFGLVFLLLSMRSRMQLSYSAFQRPCFLACLIVLHFAAVFGPVTLLKFYPQRPPLCLFLSLIARGAFVALATFLSAAYFVFYIYVRADSKHIYHLNNTSPTPAERYNRCPFAESRDWDRAAVTVCLSALFSLACAGLQLYAMLNAMGVAGGEEVFHPWPWWAFQFSCRLCELGVCLTLALVVAQPVYCSDHLPAAGSCWTELLASKSPILPGSYQWTLSQQEKLAIVDTVGLGETECLPLYTLMDERLGSSLNGLDLLYHSNRALAYRDLDLDLDLRGSAKAEDAVGREHSGGSSFTSDSTTDLRPPSPINLRRSIDEALFSEALFPMSLFSPIRPNRCSDQSANNHWTLPSNGFCDSLSADAGLYRTSSCVEISSQPLPTHSQYQDRSTEGAPASPSPTSSSTCSSPERWRGSSSSCSLYGTSVRSSSLVLCPSPERNTQQPPQQGGNVVSSGHQGHADPQRHYHTLGTTSQESLDLDRSTEADRSVQEEFISACRQIDALSICSETIDL